jgi:hypothetical protein
MVRMAISSAVGVLFPHSSKEVMFEPALLTFLVAAYQG